MVEDIVGIEVATCGVIAVMAQATVVVMVVGVVAAGDSTATDLEVY